MNVDYEINRLYNSRLLKKEGDVEIFEDAINNLISLKDASLISKMCKCFDDNCEQNEVMFGLIHAIETVDAKEYLEGVVLAAEDMSQIAKSWLQIIFYRILNSKSYCEILVEVLKNATDVQHKVVISLLIEIKEEDPELFLEKVDFVLTLLDK